MSEERAPYNPNDHMMDLKGKDYLPVAARILWCRRDHPDAVMRTTLVEWDKAEGFAMYRAEVTLPSGGHAEATATQTAKQFPQYVEKCESKALGRALGFLGYGTLAAEEEEPGNPNLSDTPVVRATRPHSNGSAPTRVSPPPTPQSAPQTLTAQEFDNAISTAWDAFEGGKVYETAVMGLNAVRARFSEEQRAVALDEVSKIREAYRERDAALAAPAFASVAG